VLFLEGFLAINVIHFNVWAPALTGQNAFAPYVHAAEMQFSNLVDLLVHHGWIDTRREYDFLLCLLVSAHTLSVDKLRIICLRDFAGHQGPNF